MLRFLKPPTKTKLLSLTFKFNWGGGIPVLGVQTRFPRQGALADRRGLLGYAWSPGELYVKAAGPQTRECQKRWPAKVTDATSLDSSYLQDPSSSVYSQTCAAPFVTGMCISLALEICNSLRMVGLPGFLNFCICFLSLDHTALIHIQNDLPLTFALSLWLGVEVGGPSPDSFHSPPSKLIFIFRLQTTPAPSPPPQTWAHSLNYQPLLLSYPQITHSPFILLPSIFSLFNSWFIYFDAFLFYAWGHMTVCVQSCVIPK